MLTNETNFLFTFRKDPIACAAVLQAAFAFESVYIKNNQFLENMSFFMWGHSKKSILWMRVFTTSHRSCVHGLERLTYPPLHWVDWPSDFLPFNCTCKKKANHAGLVFMGRKKFHTPVNMCHPSASIMTFLRYSLPSRMAACVLCF